MRQGQDRDDKVLKLLRASPDLFISGQSISNRLGISRTAVWKHVMALRNMGYSIAGSAGKGYRLTPGRDTPFNAVEIRSRLSTEFMGRKVYLYKSLGSTNIKAKELAGKGVPEGTAVIADSQTGGKGRLGRGWFSPAGVNLYTSVVLRPRLDPPKCQGITLMAAVACAEAASKWLPKKPTVKWPNDILIGPKKAAGILMEMDAEADRVNHIILGIGFNLNMTHDMLPKDLRGTAASIMEKTGRTVDRAEFACALYSRLEKWYKVFVNEGIAPVLSAWKGYFDMEGRPIRVNSFEGVVSGICAGVDTEGALLIRTASGRVHRVISGDVEIVRH
ncbi:MAG: biotin--[acetyl-CoA-carboxylase] ligase [Deltaproteobacteria bacterium]|nr:biotin--[acetyl-CoA-carboxylase] ligase [Deltaproteobacteria bacterium]